MIREVLEDTLTRLYHETKNVHQDIYSSLVKRRRIIEL